MKHKLRQVASSCATENNSAQQERRERSSCKLHVLKKVLAQLANFNNLSSHVALGLHQVAQRQKNKAEKIGRCNLKLHGNHRGELRHISEFLPLLPRQ